MVATQIGVTVLTVAAVVFSVVGVLRARGGAVAARKRMDSERMLRNQFRDRLRERQERDSGNDTANAEERQAASEEWRMAHERAGLEPFSYQSVNDGREFLAERIIVELASSSRIDALLVGVGLGCGLAASIWGTWAL